MKLYTYPVTTNALKISLLEAFLAPYVALDIEKKIIRLHKREQQGAGFLSINPKGQIPVLVNDEVDQTITESNAILMYLINLSEVKAVPELTGFSCQNEVLSWLFWQASDKGLGESGYHFHRLLMPAWGAKGHTFEPSEKQEHYWHKSCHILDKHFSKLAYLCGEEMSIADIATAAPLMFYRECHMPLDDYRHLKAWLARLESTSWWVSVKQEAEAFIKDMKHS